MMNQMIKEKRKEQIKKETKGEIIKKVLFADMF